MYEASPPPSLGFPLKLVVTVHPDGKQETEIRWPDISEAEIVLAITKCRTFLLPGEDNYLDGGTYCPGFQFRSDLTLEPVVVALFERAMELRVPHNCES